MIPRNSRFLGHIFHRIGRGLHVVGRLDAAVVWYERAAMRVPDFGPMHYHWSEALERLNRNEAAVRERVWWAVAAMKHRDFEVAVRRWREVRSWMAGHDELAGLPLLPWEVREEERANHLLGLATETLEYRRDQHRREEISRLLTGNGHSDFSSRDIHEGDRAVFVQVHTASARNERTLRPGIFEKVSSNVKDDASMTRERKLFDAVGHEALLAPAFLGRYTHGSLTSHFYELVRGVLPTQVAELPWNAKDWDELRSIIVLRQMAASVPEELAAEFDVHREFTLLATNEEGPPPAVRERYGSFLDECAEYLGTLPVGVSHSDLLHTNALLTEDKQVYVIDWEMWAILPYGATYWPNETEIQTGTLSYEWALERWGPPGLRGEAVLLSAAVALAHEEFRNGRHQLVESRLDFAKRMLRKLEVSHPI